MGKSSRVILRVWRDLRIGDVPGLPDEVAEVAVGDRSAIDPESVDFHRMSRRLLGIMLVRPHVKNAAWDPDHVEISRYLRAGFPTGQGSRYSAICLPLNPDSLLGSRCTRSNAAGILAKTRIPVFTRRISRGLTIFLPLSR